jgi:hypothetical protein
MRLETNNAFDRMLVVQGTKIRSTCRKCGHTITSSVSEGIERSEIEHWNMCRKRFAAPQRTDGSSHFQAS